MSRDPLEALLCLRQSAVDEAQSEVARAYRVECEAIESVRLTTEVLQLELREASSLVAGDETVEAFARWLPLGRKRIAEAHERQREATSALDQIRTVLMLARSAADIVEKRMQQNRDAEELLHLRREQVLMDELASRV